MTGKPSIDSPAVEITVRRELTEYKVHWRSSKGRWEWDNKAAIFSDALAGLGATVFRNTLVPFITCTDKSYRTQDNILYLLGRGFIFKQTPHENAKLGHKTSLWRQSNIWALQAFLPNLWWQDNSKDNSTQIPDNRPYSEQKMRNPETSNRDPSSSSSEATQLISNARRLQSKVIAL